MRLFVYFARLQKLPFLEAFKKMVSVGKKNAAYIPSQARCPKSDTDSENYVQWKIDNVILIYNSSQWPLIICLSARLLIAARQRAVALG